MIILGIETSCDETAVSIVEADGDLQNPRFEVLGSAVNSQIKIHEEFGGVVPNLAKREHQKNLPIVLEEALEKAGFLNQKSEIRNSKQIQNLNDKNRKQKIDLIAVTVGPGLEPALWTGINFAENLGKKWEIPVIGANHMEGHIASVLLHKTDENPKLEFPAIALLISGGHTELISMKNWSEKEKIGETKDDAVGEAFDKVARMLSLPYPGGPEISKLAEEARLKNIKLETKFPRPMIHSNDFDFSFSGLKTAVLYYLRNLKNYSSPQSQKCTDKILLNFSSCSLQSSSQGISEAADSKNFSKEKIMTVAREFEDAVIEVLLAKTKKAIEKYLPKTLVIGGGVIANKALRENFEELKKYYPEIEILIPQKSLTTDNAVMIAVAGYFEYLRNGKNQKELSANGNLKI